MSSSGATTETKESERDHSPPGNRPNMSDLRIVLVGKNASENTRVGNLILNKNVFGKKTPQPDVETVSESVEGRNITVISTTHLLNPGLRLQTITHNVSKLSPPEPRVIILVLQHNDFTEKNRNILPSVLTCFSDQAMKRTMILTADDDKFENEYILEISTECGGGHLQLQNTQRSQILQKVDEIISHGVVKETQQVSSLHAEHRKSQRRRSEERPNMCDLRIILLGKNLSENSRVRNSILGIDVHESDAPIMQHSVTKIGGTVKDRHITAINTFHLLDLNISDHQITQTVRECVYLSDPGPHVFIIILQYKDFTEENVRRVKHVLNKFSEEAIKRTIVLTTDEETDDSHMSPVIKHTRVHQLIKECGGRHIEFEKESPEWQSDICKRVDKILKESHEEYLTCEIYEDVKGTSVDEEQSGSDDPARSEEKNKEHSYSKDDGKPKQSKRIEGSLIEISQWIRSNLPSNFSGKQKLNLVLCGSDPTSKVSVSKLLRGKNLKFSHQREISEDCVKKEERIHKHQISLVELPALTRLSEEEVKHQTLRCVSLCDPGVHAFIIIIPVGPLTDEVKAEMEEIQKNFYSREHLIVMFVNDGTVKRPVTEFIKHSPESQRLISHCGGQYCVMGLKEPENTRQMITELLDYVGNMKTEPYSLQMYMKAQENRARHETEEKYKEKLKRMENEIKALKQKINSEGAECSDDPKCLRIVLIGRTGNGKSATGNTILGRNEFVSQASMDSVTTDCQKGVGEVDGRSVAVVDTPGLFDTTLSNEQAVEEIVKCVSLSSPGPHVFVIVLSVGRFIQVETDTVDLIKKIFGPKAAQFSIVLFTRGDDLEGESIEKYVERGNNAEVKKLIRDCGNRFLVFNNRERQDKTQVIQLLNMIEELKNTNEGRYFTNSMFEEAEMSIKKRMEDILKEREREIQTQNEKLKAKYEREMKNIMKRLEEEKQRADEERMKMQSQFRENEEKLRKEFEEKEKTEQKKREAENQKRSEEEKQQRAEYHHKIEEMKNEIENQRSQHEKLQKEREEEDRKREERYRQEQEKLKKEQGHIITELKIKQEEEIKKRDLENKRRNEEEEKERQEWVRKIKEAENDRKEEITRQQREWEDEKKRQMREREEEERKRKEKHEEQLREKHEELEKMRKRFEREREEEREKFEEERLKQRREREEKEREYEEKKLETRRYYDQLEQERKMEWERRKREEDERREEERKRWKKMIEDVKQEQEEEMKRREREERGRKEREEKERDEIKKEYEEKIKVIKKKHEDEARKQAEEFNDFRERKEQHVQELQQMLEEHQKQQELLNKLYHHFKDEKSEEVKNLKNEIEVLKKQWCRLM